MDQIIGKVHSIETCGTVDGPGIRFVAFLQGCPLRCQYCHNPDTWKAEGGMTYTPEELFQELIKYKTYMKFSKGGVTLTGGEPLLQTDFSKALFQLCKDAGIHTALDTSGYLFNERVKEVLELTDLVLLDIKNYDPTRYKEVTGVALDPTLKFMNYLGEIGKKVWVRYVLVPGLTDNIEAIEGLAQYLASFTNVEKIEVLPFHKMGEYKWKELGLTYQLENTPEPSGELKAHVLDIFKRKNPNVLVV